MRRELANDLGIARMAGAQHGVVRRRQLLAFGLSVAAIEHRVRAGRLHRIHQGVYAVGHPVLTVEGRWMAAVLAAGGDAVLSHASAAAAWELRPVGAGAIHVTVPGDPGRARRAGIRIHRSATLEPDEATCLRGIPITTPVRTVIDLAATLKGRPLEQALDRAEQRKLIDFAELHEAIKSYPTRPGSPSLQAQLSRYTAGTVFTRSELEERFLALCDQHGLPRPKVNTRIEGSEVDFAWRDAGLIVEVDGYAYHRSPSAFEDDRARDVALSVAGWTVLRFTWAQVTRRSAWVADAVRRRLATLRRDTP
jgi:very-short-patch-repair endonuclease/predicted transcriptional regulator of viral defense system